MRSLHRRTFPAAFRPLGNPLLGFRLPTEYHQPIPQGTTGKALPNPLPPCSFRGFFPFSVFSPRGATYPNEIPTRWLRCVHRVATLPTLCSPHSLPSLFHPGSALGVDPSRPRSSFGAAHPSECRFPHGVGSRTRVCDPSCRASHTKRVLEREPGISRDSLSDASLGFTSPGLLVLSAARRYPSRALPERPQADRSAGASGFYAQNAAPLSRDEHGPHEVLHLVDPLESKVLRNAGVMGSPRKPIRVAAICRLLFALLSSTGRSSSRAPYR